MRHCEQHGIGFIPWFPLPAGRLAEPGGPVPIPGTGSLEHLEENVAAAELQLTEEQAAELDRAA